MYDNETKVMEIKCQFCTQGFKPSSIPRLVSNAWECRGHHVNAQLSNQKCRMNDRKLYTGLWLYLPDVASMRTLHALLKHNGTNGQPYYTESHAVNIISLHQHFNKERSYYTSPTWIMISHMLKKWWGHFDLSQPTGSTLVPTHLHNHVEFWLAITQHPRGTVTSPLSWSQ